MMLLDSDSAARTESDMAYGEDKKAKNTKVLIAMFVVLAVLFYFLALPGLKAARHSTPAADTSSLLGDQAKSKPAAP